MSRIAVYCTTALVAALAAHPSNLATAGEPGSLAPDHVAAIAADNLAATTDRVEPAEVHLNLIDQKLALSLAVDMQGQIEMSEFAQTALSSDAVRDFVESRIESQRAFAANLDRLTDGRATAAIAQAHREIEQDRADDKREKRFRLMSLRNASALLARIRLEILREYAQLVQNELDTKTAGEFDRLYLRGEIHSQMEMLAALKVFESQASADFAQVIHQARLRAQDDLQQTRQLLFESEAALAKAAPANTPLVEAIEVKLPQTK